MSTSGTFGLPRPLMYGPSFPSIRMVMRDGVQVFESRTNQNLFLDTEDFNADGTFPMARLLQTLSPCQGCGDRRPGPDGQAAVESPRQTWRAVACT
jgi:hypothetical protein